MFDGRRMEVAFFYIILIMETSISSKANPAREKRHEKT